MGRKPTLDPENWADFRAQSHAALDAAIDHMEGRSGQPVWQPVPENIRKSLQQELPLEGQPRAALCKRIAQDFLPYNVGNTHARFFGWVHGAGTPDGLIPEMFTAAMNANLGGRDHVAIDVEKQVIDWCRQMFSFPESAGGLVVSGTSMATLIALKSAREKHGGLGLRASGLQGGPRLVGYASTQAHSCIARTFDILGLGKDALRAIPVDGDYRMDVAALRAAIERDLADGLQPFCVIGTAGTVNVGSVDPLRELADIAGEFDLWLHVDGAFGALAVLNSRTRDLLEGIERSTSIAFDFHKWMHVNYDAGFVLIRRAEDQRRAFSERPDYLEGAARGLAAGNPWFCEYGPELSRGFRALKIWYHLSRFGTRRIGEKIADNCDQAQALAGMVRRANGLELLAPVALNITCFRAVPDGLDAVALDDLNARIVVALQERGLAAPSTTRLGGKLAIRVNITNHRTQIADLEFLVARVLELAKGLA
ncbi:MAG: cytochrome D ubiquinol oxidase subunit I [Alphaproteobacteria bacterium]|nr:cytochrome D ubiquinol oxidase subunit I [Alphaproteobacteria bacterium]